MVDKDDAPGLRELVMRFVRVISLGWREVIEAVPLVNRQDMLNDWLQFHWELLVGWPLRLAHPGLYLEIYGEGAETDTSRISDASAIASHRVCCRPVTGDYLKEMVCDSVFHFPASGFPIEAVVNYERGQLCKSEPPFNAVLVSARDEATLDSQVLSLAFRLDELDFVLQSLESPL